MVFQGRAFLDGVNVGALAPMIIVTFELGRTALVDWLTVALACASAFLLIRFDVNSAWLVLGGALIGFSLAPRENLIGWYHRVLHLLTLRVFLRGAGVFLLHVATAIFALTYLLISLVENSPRISSTRMMSSLNRRSTIQSGSYTSIRLQ